VAFRDQSVRDRRPAHHARTAYTVAMVVGARTCDRDLTHASTCDRVSCGKRAMSEQRQDVVCELG
jgi:hypothetical protein